MAYKLGFYAGASPFYGSRLAFWRHHDAVFKKLCKEHDVEMHVVLPVQGGQQFVDRLYNGDTNVLYPTLREMNITFHTDPVHIPTLDSIYIDDIHSFQDVTVQGILFTADEQKEILHLILEHLIEDNKPIVFSDTDGFCTEILEDTKAEMMDLYEKFKDYPNLSVISPFENGTLRKEIGDRFHVVPFEVDPDDFQPIKSLSEREYLLRYVGNEYYRQHFIPVFENLSKVGKVKVNGAGWNPYRHLAPDVEWGPKVSMSPDNVHRVYSDSAIGLTGRSSYNADKGQIIYLYRWKEYLSAGTLIVPEYLPEYTEKLDNEGLITAEAIVDLGTNYLNALKMYFAMSDETYEARVKEQRKNALEFFGVDKWVPVFKTLFGFKD